MGGLIARSYIKGLAWDACRENNDDWHYRDNVDALVMIAPPNQGSPLAMNVTLFFYVDLSAPAAQQVRSNFDNENEFLRLLNSVDFEESVSQLVILGYNNSITNFLLERLVRYEFDRISIQIPYFQRRIDSYGISDAIVNARSAYPDLDNGDGIYKFRGIYRHHGNMRNDVACEITQEFLDDPEEFESDRDNGEYGARFAFITVNGERIEPPNAIPQLARDDDVIIIPNIALHLIGQSTGAEYYAQGDINGSATLPYVIADDYLVVISADGMLPDTLRNSFEEGSQIHLIGELEDDPEYVGPIFCSLSIQSDCGYAYTNELDINITYEYATQIILSEDVEFEDCEWIDINDEMSFTFSDGEGLKTLWAKFRDDEANESSQVFDLVVIREEDCETGIIRVTSSVDGANVYLDGTNTNTETPCTFDDIPVGQHIVSVSFIGMQVEEITQTIDVETNEEIEVNFELNNIPPGVVRNSAVYKTESNIVLVWRNPNDQDLDQITIRHHGERYPESPEDGSQIYQEDADPGEEQEAILEPDFEIDHYFTVFTFDGEFYSTGQRLFCEAGTPVPEIAISLARGWNLISINIQPSEEFYDEDEDRGPNVVTMTEQIVDNLILIKDEDGQFYYPEFNYNGIPFWNLTEGYSVKVNEDVNISWQGVRKEPDTDIPIEEGWNIIAYYPNYDLSCEFIEDDHENNFYVISEIIDRVIIAKDANGDFCMPDWDYSGMADWTPGQGYMIYLTEDIEVFNYPVELDERAAMPEHNVKSPGESHWTKPVSTGANMSVLVTSVKGLTVNDGDQIAAFNTKGDLIGAGTFYNGKCGFAVWGDDKITEPIDGLLMKEAFYLCLWSPNISAEIDLAVEAFKTGNCLVYEPNGLLVVDVVVEPRAPEYYYLFPSYPNPFNSVTRLRYDMPEVAQVSIQVYDLSGRIVDTLFNGEQNAGHHIAIWDSRDAATGIYLVRMQSNGFTVIRKITLIR